MNRILLIFIMLVFGSIGTASAVPVQFLGNGHYYEVMTTGYYGSPSGDDFNGRWHAAYLNSTQYSYLGQVSYFATITSAEENAFIATLVHEAGITAFLGAKQPSGSEEPYAEWSWIATDEEFTYRNWAINEPDDLRRDDWLEMSIDGTWYDSHIWKLNTGYVVEYDGAPVPEPSTILLLGSGLAGLFFYRRKVK